MFYSLWWAEWNDTLFHHIWFIFYKNKREIRNFVKNAKNRYDHLKKTFLFINGFSISWISNWSAWKMESFDINISSLAQQIKKLTFSGARTDRCDLWPPWGWSKINFKNLKKLQWFHIMKWNNKTPGEQRNLKKAKLWNALLIVSTLYIVIKQLFLHFGLLPNEPK